MKRWRRYGLLVLRMRHTLRDRLLGLPERYGRDLRAHVNAASWNLEDEFHELQLLRHAF